MRVASPRIVLVASALTLVTGCFEPEVPGSTAGTSGGPGSEAGPASDDSPGESGNETGASGCSVDGDCVDVDTCSIDTCEAGSCVHTPNVDDPECICTTPADCDQLPEDSECRTRTCDGGVCGLDFAASGTPLNATQQTAEDCRLVVCDGAGEVESVVDDTDVPVDGLECTSDSCDGGMPSNPPVASGTVCAAGECDADGDCIGCSDAADCGGESTFCEVVTCVDQVCGIDTTEAGTALPEQTPGDCQRLECDGEGNAASVADSADPPPDEGNDCTEELCEDGVPQHVAVPVDAACDDNGGSFCDGQGTCVECTSNSQCGGGGGCMMPACVDQACTLVPNAGAPCNDGLFCTANDECNAAGACVGSGDPCPGADGDSDCSEGCNETTDTCSGIDPSGSPCNDGLFCTANDSCNNSGTCVGSGNPCPGADGDSDCSETCNESSNACSSNDPNGTDCGACRTCSNGTCNFLCNALAMCCPDDLCISQGQSCP
jgi:hypothetical protein